MIYHIWPDSDNASYARYSQELLHFLRSGAYAVGKRMDISRFTFAMFSNHTALATYQPKGCGRTFYGRLRKFWITRRTATEAPVIVISPIAKPMSRPRSK